jgi:hypothetical protein
MSALRTILFLAIGTILMGASLESGQAGPGVEVLERYLAASQAQQAQMRGFSMQVDIDASVPKLKMRGTLHALRNISKLGQITYKALNFVGDKTIRNDVIARYLTAETHATTNQPADMAITPANYKFKYKGLVERENRLLHVFQLTPRKKRLGLFKGEIWVDAATYMPLRESGRMVKNPSVFLKKVTFIRDYEIRDGIAFPRHLESTIQTRLVGTARLDVSFRDFAKADPTQACATQSAGAE